MGELHTDTVISKPVGVVKTLFVASPQLFEKPFENFEKPNNIKQLFQLPIADWANVNDKHFTWKMGKEKISYEPKFSTNDIQAILHYVLNWHGCGVVARIFGKKLSCNRRINSTVAQRANAYRIIIFDLRPSSLSICDCQGVCDVL